jgi:hypothetical protein
MQTKLVGIAFLVMCVLVRPASSAEDGVHLIVYGSGNLSCGSFNEGSAAEKAEFIDWVEGFVTGVGSSGILTLRHILDPGTAFGGYIKKRCSDHPLDSIQDVAHSLVDDLSEPSQPSQ